MISAEKYNFEMKSTLSYTAALLEIDSELFKLARQHLNDFEIRGPTHDEIAVFHQFKAQHHERRQQQQGRENQLIQRQQHYSFENDELIVEQKSYASTAEELQTLEQKINNKNSEQRAAFDEFKRCLDGGENKMYFLDGPAGTGKTYVYDCLLAYARSIGNKVAIAVASAGAAASLLKGGRTAHSMFEIPINIHENSCCFFRHRSARAELFQMCRLCIWDEAPMAHRYVIEAVLRTLQSLEIQMMFVFGGDFRQTLPVIPKASRAQIIDAALFSSETVWPNVTTYRLTHNMRLENKDPRRDEFAKFLLDVGSGNVPIVEAPDVIEIPQWLCSKGTKTGQVRDLVDEVFDNLSDNFVEESKRSSFFVHRAILTPLNATADRLNSEVLQILHDQKLFQEGREVREFKSVDSIEDVGDGKGDAGAGQKAEMVIKYPTEFLNSLTISGIPPHKLTLVVGIPVMLLRNIDVSNGDCNGTRYIIRTMKDHVLEVESISGSHTGRRVFLPRISLNPSNQGSLPFKLRRRQFPIRAAFAMTINKSQGQSLQTVGIYAPDGVFGHGQLYTALSRAMSSERCFVMARKTYNNKRKKTIVMTKNIVYDAVARQVNNQQQDNDMNGNNRNNGQQQQKQVVMVDENDINDEEHMRRRRQQQQQHDDQQSLEEDGLQERLFVPPAAAEGASQRQQQQQLLHADTAAAAAEEEVPEQFWESVDYGDDD
jgi:ATP-dependent DNA helicase PIF1